MFGEREGERSREGGREEGQDRMGYLCMTLTIAAQTPDLKGGVPRDRTGHLPPPRKGLSWRRTLQMPQATRDSMALLASWTP